MTYGYQEEDDDTPSDEDEISEELSACPGASDEIEQEMRDRAEDEPDYGVGPGGDPNCTEAACDIIENAGHDMPDEWMPGGLHDALQN